MIKIYKNKDGTYLLTTQKTPIACSTLQKLIQVMKAIEITDNEIEAGLIEFETTDNNVLEYGINRTFIYGKKV